METSINSSTSSPRTKFEFMRRQVGKVLGIKDKPGGGSDQTSSDNDEREVLRNPDGDEQQPLILTPDASGYALRKADEINYDETVSTADESEDASLSQSKFDTPGFKDRFLRAEKEAQSWQLEASNAKMECDNLKQALHEAKLALDKANIATDEARTDNSIDQLNANNLLKLANDTIQKLEAACQKSKDDSRFRESKMLDAQTAAENELIQVRQRANSAVDVSNTTRTSLRTTKHNISTLSTELDIAKSRLATCDSSITGMRADIAKMKAQHEADLTDAKGELQLKEVRLQKATADLRCAQSTSLDLANENDTLKKAAAVDNTDIIKTKEVEIQSLKSKVISFESAAIKTDDKLTKALNKLSQLQKDFNKANSFEKTLRSRLSSAETDAAQKADTIASMIAAKAIDEDKSQDDTDWETQCSTLQVQVQTLESAVSYKDAAIVALQESIQDRTVEFNKVEDDLKFRMDANKNLESELYSLRRQLKESRGKIQDSSSNSQWRDGVLHDGDLRGGHGFKSLQDLSQQMNGSSLPRTVTPPVITIRSDNSPKCISPSSIEREIRVIRVQISNTQNMTAAQETEFKSKLYTVAEEIKQLKGQDPPNSPGRDKPSRRSRKRLDRKIDELKKLHKEVVEMMYFCPVYNANKGNSVQQGSRAGSKSRRSDAAGSDKTKGAVPRRSTRRRRSPSRYSDPFEGRDRRRSRRQRKKDKRSRSRSQRRHSSRSSSDGSYRPGRKQSPPSSDPSSSSDSSASDSSSAGRRRGFGDRNFSRGTESKPWYRRRGQEGSGFYKRLPEPWNVKPDADNKHSAADIGRLIQNNFLDTFHGHVDHYFSFRDQFIQMVHTANVSITLKYNSLKACLKTLNLNIIKTTHSNPEGYKLVIKKLEKNYGGTERILAHYHDALAKIQIVHENNLEELETLVDTLEGHRSVLPRGKLHEGDSIGYAMDMVDKLDDTLTKDYINHCDQKGYRSMYSVSQLIKWLKRSPINVLRSSVERSSHKLLQSRVMYTAKPQTSPRERSQKQDGAGANRRREEQDGAGSGRRRDGAATKTTQDKRAHDTCECCNKKGHSIVKCSKFLKKSPSTQKSLLQGLELCINCGASGHYSPKFKKPGCSQCERKHLTQFHPLYQQRRRTNFVEGDIVPDEEDLCELAARTASTTGSDSEAAHSASRSESSDCERRTNVTVCNRRLALKSFAGYGARSASSLRFVTFRLINPQTKKAANINAILDDGANVSTLDSKVAEELGLKGDTYKAEYMGFGGKISKALTTLTEVYVENANGLVRRKIQVETIPDPLAGLKMADWRELSKGWPHMESAAFNKPAGDGRCQMIIGTDQSYFHRSLQEKFSADPTAPVARLTPLGWCAIGKVKAKAERDAHPGDFTKVSNHIFRKSFPEGSAHRRLFHHEINILPLEEVFKPVPLLNAGDRKAVSDMDKYSEQDSTGRVTAPVLWKSEERPSNNFQEAKRIWLKHEKTLNKDTKTRKLYDDAFKSWIDAGYVTELDEAAGNQPDSFYIPHFAVTRTDRQTTKLRIVLNCKSEFGGRSLNSFVAKGPKIFNHITSVLTKFRMYRLAGISDVKEMFLRLRMRTEDKHYHRVIYTPLGRTMPVIFEFDSHVFGNTGSPGVAVITSKMQAIKNEEVWPEAAEVVLNNSIIDDNLFSSSSLEGLTRIAHGINEIFTGAGMTVHKWAVTHEECLPPGAQKADILPVQSFPDEAFYADRKALGLLWHSSLDHFTFQFAPGKDEGTYLDMLRVHMSLYDPLGFILPFVLMARLIYRDMWQIPKKLDIPRPKWNNKLMPEHQKRWAAWKAELPLLGNVKIPRHIGLKDARWLIVCSDASFDAYGAVAYMLGDSPILLASKARTNKDASASINRLELQGAVSALELAQKIWKALKWDPRQTKFFIDNRSVLTWIRNPGREVDRFAARRVALIRTGSYPETWGYIETHRNPAKIVSRGAGLKDLIDSELWFQGADFFKDESLAPLQDIPVTTHEEVKNEQTYNRLMANFNVKLHGGEPEECNRETAFVFHGDKRSTAAAGDLFKDFSTWKRRISAANSLRKAVERWMKPVLKSRGQTEWRKQWKPEHILLRAAQFESFEAEVNRFQMGRELPKRHEWRRFDYEYKSHVIWIKGRASKLWRPLLQHFHPSTLAWLTSMHSNSLSHGGGPKTLLATSRERTWIFKGILACKFVIKRCIKCRKIRPKRLEQKMAPLPEYRLAGQSQDYLVIDTTYIDFTGPYQTVQTPTSQKEKRYFLVLTCSRTRAVHIEFCLSKSSDEVLMALQRFASRRGLPRRLVSDNAKEFKGCAKFMRREGRQRLRELPNRRWDSVDWIYYRSLAPHMGGTVESMVKLLKTAMEKVMQPLDVTDFQLLTCGIFAEDIINRRPICTLSEDPNDGDIITPNDFLKPGRLADFDLEQRDGDQGLAKVWIKLNKVRRAIWRQFAAEYAMDKEVRKKWNTEKRPIKVGELVLCIDKPLTIEGKWPLARVVRIDASADGLVRSVAVELQGKIYDRHVKSLAPLFEMDEPGTLGARS